MITLLLILLLLSGLFWLGFHITGAILKACIWVGILLPVTLCLWGIAVVCCCTLILIPVGMLLFKVGASILF